MNSNFLPSKQFPLIFKAVEGHCQSGIGCNRFNQAEVDEVISTVKHLLPPNSKTEGLKRIPSWSIGVVTPYHMQNYKIVEALKAINMGKVEVGTAESFRGKQKAAIIISTVLSTNEPFNFEASSSEPHDCVAPFAKEVSSNFVNIVSIKICLFIV